MKKIFAVLIILSLAGCCPQNKITITTKTVPVAVPLLYAPAPPVLARPTLPHLTISPTDEKVDGKVVQSYAASVEALIKYAEELEKITANYKNINDAYASLRAKLIEEWKANTGVDITVEDPTVQTDEKGAVTIKPPAIKPTTPETAVVPPVGDLVNHP